MNAAPSSTWFTASPEWGWLIALYFVFSGLAAGCYFLAALIDAFGRPEDRPLARMGYYIALPFIAVSGILLLFDLTRPDRFWHLLVESNSLEPMFKYWSPMSIGSWALVIFGFFTFVSFVAALAESGRLRWRSGARLRAPGALGTAVSILGSVAGLYIAGYAGVLLMVTNRPIWADTPLIGMLLIVSAISISTAFLVLLGYRSLRNSAALQSLHRMDVWLIALEFVVLVALVVSLGEVATAWLNVWGLLLVAVVLIGMVLPLALHWRGGWLGERSAPAAAALVLLGGFILRAVIVLSSEAI